MVGFKKNCIFFETHTDLWFLVHYLSLFRKKLYHQLTNWIGLRKVEQSVFFIFKNPIFAMFNNFSQWSHLPILLFCQRDFSEWFVVLLCRFMTLMHQLFDFCIEKERNLILLVVYLFCSLVNSFLTIFIRILNVTTSYCLHYISSFFRVFFPCTKPIILHQKIEMLIDPLEQLN